MPSGFAVYVPWVLLAVLLIFFLFWWLLWRKRHQNLMTELQQELDAFSRYTVETMDKLEDLKSRLDFGRFEEIQKDDAPAYFKYRVDTLRERISSVNDQWLSNIDLRKDVTLAAAGEKILQGFEQKEYIATLNDARKKLDTLTACEEINAELKQIEKEASEINTP